MGKPMTNPDEISSSSGRSGTIVTTGLIVLDVIISSNCDGILWAAGGTAGNVACNLAHLGHKATPFCRIGTDRAGALLLEDFSSSGIDISLIWREDSTATPIIVEGFSGPWIRAIPTTDFRLAARFPVQDCQNGSLSRTNM